MATFGRYDSIPGLLAGADLSSSQYKVVKAASTAGEVVVASAATDVVLGVIQNDPADGEAADVAFAGICKVLSEASVTYGAALMPSTTGRVKVAATANNQILGVALEAGSVGQIIRMIIGPRSNL